MNPEDNDIHSFTLTGKTVNALLNLLNDKIRHLENTYAKGKEFSAVYREANKEILSQLAEESLKPEDKYSYHVAWSDEDKMFVGTCTELANLSHLDNTIDNAFDGIRRLVEDTMKVTKL